MLSKSTTPKTYHIVLQNIILKNSPVLSRFAYTLI